MYVSLSGLHFISGVQRIARHGKTKAGMWPAMCGNYREWFSGERMASLGTPHLIMEHWCRVIEWCVILTWIVQNTKDKEDVPWKRTVLENILTSPSLSLSISSREGGMCAWRSRGWHSVTCMNAGSGAWNSWGAAGGDSRTPSCSLVFHSRLLTLHGAEGTYSSHTALSSNTGSFFPWLSSWKFSHFYKPLFPLL